MRYAIVVDAVVANIIELHEVNAKDFPDAQPMGDAPVAVGDTFDGQHYYHDGVVLVGAAEATAGLIRELDAAYVDLAYQYALMASGLETGGETIAL